MASKKLITVVTTRKEFDTVLSIIKTSSNFLAEQIHIAGIFALNQANIHSNAETAQQLIESMGKKHDKARVQKWLIHFGKIGVKKGIMVYRKRKDILPENVEAWAHRAEQIPYWELNKQAEVKFTFDYLSLVNSIIATHDKKVAELVAAGKSVNEVNVGLLDGLKQLVHGYTPAVEVK